MSRSYKHWYSKLRKKTTVIKIQRTFKTFMKNSDWILYQSEKWLDEEINSRGLKNEHELYWATLHSDNRHKDTKVTG